MFVQGEAGVDPGTIGASLIPPSGGTLPLLRGEAVPGGVAPRNGPGGGGNGRLAYCTLLQYRPENVQGSLHFNADSPNRRWK